ncbi:MAG TPA: hypothetical protein VF041_22815 [Gemmatimonadaceae bacterium]
MLVLQFAIACAIAAPLSAQARERENVDVPQGHRPPPGMCRIWIDGVPPARQPAPTDCATAIRRRPPNARVVFGAELRAPRDQRDDHPDPGVKQLVPPAKDDPRAQPPRPAERTDSDRTDEARPRPRIDRRPSEPPPPPPAPPPARDDGRIARPARGDDRGRAAPRDDRPQRPRTVQSRPRGGKPPQSFRRFER